LLSLYLFYLREDFILMMSMTGQGHATGLLGTASIEVDVRSVNNRFLKVSSRISDRLSSLEGSLESIIREYVGRGTVQLNIRLAGEYRADQYRLNSVAIEAYARQANSIAEKLGLSQDLSIGHLLQLPGVVDEGTIGDDDSELQALGKEVVRQALTELNRMREQEGQAMGVELSTSLAELRKRASVVLERAPLVVEDYRIRLHTKVDKALQGLGVALEPSDILREVQLFADKCDIREELVRLESHFNQFENACKDKASQGRKLDFLVQELNREINTIGSKANDAVITEQVVNMKTTLEQIRELVQNIE
jgi:uncharacterized protein (TIGR00255 family)